MLGNNKKSALTIEWTIILILGLVALVVLLYIFVNGAQTSGKGITSVQEDTNRRGDEARNLLDDLFGGCKDNEKKCNLARTKVLICDGGSWSEQDDCREKGMVCELDKCVSEDD
ncbi:hypothetical protein JXB41_01510 [Candidatus Woesearchaeota archaeon]|nr:hypothetical protein [Candidatus Woesearchaeota archaeon]